MKNITSHPRPSVKLLIAIMLLGVSYSTTAQTFVPATGIEQIITSLSATPANNVVVNNDFYEFADMDPAGSGLLMNGFIKAVVWGKEFNTSGTGKSESHLWVQDNLGSTATVQLPDSAIQPDVSISEDWSGGSSAPAAWRILVVYNLRIVLGGVAHYEPRLIVYDLIGVASGSLSLSLASPGFTNPYSLSTNRCGRNPHIDMWTDINTTNPHIGFPSRHEYAIVWSDDPTNSDLYAAHGDILSGTAPTIIPSIRPNCYMPDVACVTEDVGGAIFHQEMEIVYGNANLYTTPVVQTFQLTHMEYNISTTGLTTRTLEDSVSFWAPRIEAMSQYDGTALNPPAKWYVAANVKFVRINGLPPGLAPTAFHAAGYNDFMVPAAPGSPMYTTHEFLSYNGFTADVKGACVGAGVGTVYGGGNIGNNQYTPGFFPWPSTSNLTRYAREVVASTGVPATTNYYEINNNPANPVNYHCDVDQAMAIANCSNSGQDIFTSWYNGTDIVWKHSNPNVMSFRLAPSTINNSTLKSKGIYPNPVIGELHVDGMEGFRYAITDMTGRLLQQGVLENRSILNVESFMPGLYILSVQSSDKNTRTFKLKKD